MFLRLLSVSLLIVCLLRVEASPVPDGWDQRAGVMPVYPGSGTAVSTNPPTFSWPAGQGGPYQLDIRDSKGHIRTYTPGQNWLLIDGALVPGQYEWKVTNKNGRPGVDRWRSFDVQSSAVEWPVPSTDILLGRAKTHLHPRSVNPEALRENAKLDGKSANALLGKIGGWSGEALPLEPSVNPALLEPGAGRDAAMMAIQKLVFGEENKVLPEALVWLATRNAMALSDAKRRALNLASWDVNGTTGFRVHDQAGLSIAWTLALAYDWLYPEFNESERGRLNSAIGERLKQIMSNVPFGLDDVRRLNTHPFDSHGADALARVSAICTVMAGVSPQFDACFRNTVPRYLMWPVPWGRDDGGYANGTTYGQWDTTFTHLIVWDLLRQSLGVDLTKTPWAQGYGKFITYFLPPGTPTGEFGDGAEKNWRQVWATQAKAYAASVPSPLTDWYARQQFGENEASLPLLLAPSRDWSKTPAQIPADTPNAILMPSIGWVAMHSNLADRGRTSVYFKSSPYGSFNHSHADQNSFVINAQGQPLAIDSGYYDYYNSPHWKGWYKQTRAHNAITFDGGQGQLFDTMAAKGKITQFETTPVYDLVTGDATQAYGGALTRAVRSMVYVRPGTLLVFDSLASATPRRWEWNIHAMEAMKETGARSIEIDEEGERLCVEVLNGPGVGFSQTDQFTFAPSGTYPKQWHGTFRSVAPSKDFRMLTLLSVGCEHPAVAVTDKPGTLEVAVGGQHFAFSSAAVEHVQ